MAERRYNLVFYAAIVTAVIATFGVYRYLQQAKLSGQVSTQSVVVAARDVTEGEKLDRLALSATQWPSGKRLYQHRFGHWARRSRAGVQG
jgi:Flp pilus assembly protein CpaB